MNEPFIFFGSSPISITVLEALKARNFSPSLIITKPDSPKGRGLVLSPSEVKVWGEINNIKVITPEKIKDKECLDTLRLQNCQFAILVSYGKIIPKEILDLFPKGIINVHPSLLPILRGPAPIEYSILNDLKNQTGVSIMLLDQKMDEGPVLAQRQVMSDIWPPSRTELYNTLSKIGGELLAEILPDFIAGKISATPQDHTQATYSQIIKKEDGEINLQDNPYTNFLKYKAYETWPGIFYFEQKKDKKIRVKITEATFENNYFKILKVIPEGKKEMKFEDFKRN